MDTETKAVRDGAGFRFQQPQLEDVRSAILDLGRIAIRTQGITEHEAASAAQDRCLAAIEAAVTASLAAPSAAGRDRSWPANYQETFDAIAKATTVHPNGSLGISVKAFYRALSYPETPCENRYDASETLTNPAAPTETITPTAPQGADLAGLPDFGPDLGASTGEPSIRMLARSYYRPHFEKLEVDRLTEAYCVAIQARIGALVHATSAPPAPADRIAPKTLDLVRQARQAASAERALYGASKDAGDLYDELADALGDASRVVAPTSGESPLERIRHKKRGAEYEVLGEAGGRVSTGSYRVWPRGADPHSEDASLPARLVHDGVPLSVYRCTATGKLWWRFPDEMRGGRFEPAPHPASRTEGERP